MQIRGFTYIQLCIFQPPVAARVISPLSVYMDEGYHTFGSEGLSFQEFETWWGQEVSLLELIIKWQYFLGYFGFLTEN